MLISTVTLVAICFLGVIGVVDRLEPYEDAMMVVWTWGSSIAIGGFMFVSSSEADWVKSHEYGHVQQERILGLAYYLVVGIPSLVLNIMLYRDNISVSELLSKWPESWATELGGA